MSHCPLHDNLRCQLWPVETPVAKTFFGSLDDLQCTVAFMQKTGVFSVIKEEKEKETPHLSNTCIRFRKLIPFSVQ